MFRLAAVAALFLSLVSCPAFGQTDKEVEETLKKLQEIKEKADAKAKQTVPAEPAKPREALKKVRAWERAQKSAWPLGGWSQLKTGLVFKARAFIAFQILGERSMLAHVEWDTKGRPSGDVVGLVGLPTEGIADGQQFTPPAGQLFEVTGTRPYETVGGFMKTIFVVVPLEKPTAEEVARAKVEQKEELKELAAKALPEADAETTKAMDALVRAQKNGTANRATVEAAAKAKLWAAKLRLELERNDEAAEQLQAIVEDYPYSKAAAEARKLLAKLKR
jgi:hypothetical protein